MKEKEFQKRLKVSLQEAGAWVHNIADMPRSEEDEETGKRMIRFIPEKPGDLIGVFNGTPFLIECKMIRKIGKVSNKIFQGAKDKKNQKEFDEWHQIKSLDSFHEAGGLSFVFLNIYIKEKRINLCVPLIWRSACPMALGMRHFFKKDEVTKDQLLYLMNDKSSVQYKKGYDLSNFFKIFFNAKNKWEENPCGK